MTDSEYLSQRKELENRIAQLDAAHLNDREYMDGDHVHIDIGWKSVCGMICGCNGEIQGIRVITLFGCMRSMMVFSTC